MLLVWSCTERYWASLISNSELSPHADRHDDDVSRGVDSRVRAASDRVTLLMLLREARPDGADEQRRAPLHRNDPRAQRPRDRAPHRCGGLQAAHAQPQKVARRCVRATTCADRTPRREVGGRRRAGGRCWSSAPHTHTIHPARRWVSVVLSFACALLDKQGERTEKLFPVVPQYS